MSLSHAEITRVVAEIEPLLVGGRVDRIASAGPASFVLTVYARGEKRHLLVAVQPGYARLHLVAERPRGDGDPPPFVRAARRALRGPSLASIRLDESDRIVELAFGRPDEPAGRLIAELTGRTSNAYLVSANGRILAALRSTRKAERNLRPGALYEPPPPAQGATPSQRDRFADALAHSEAVAYSEAVARHYATAETEDRVRSLRSGLAGHIRAERKRTARLVGRLEADLGTPEQAERLRLCGELLKMHLGQIQPRQDRITVPNVFEADAPPIDVELRPSLNARQNMERYFRRYKKLAAAREQVSGRLAAARRRLDKLDAAALAVQEAATADELEGLAAELGSKKPRGAQRRAPHEGPLSFVSADGFEILVGRSTAENDQLTFRIARGNDLWLHVEGYNGSHVVVRVPKGKSVPKETLLDAATLAVHFSQLRKAGGGPVAYCARKHVVKPRGAQPGSVLYSQNKLLHVDIGPARLDRLFRRGE